MLTHYKGWLGVMGYVYIVHAFTRSNATLNRLNRATGTRCKQTQRQIFAHTQEQFTQNERESAHDHMKKKCSPHTNTLTHPWLILSMLHLDIILTLLPHMEYSHAHQSGTSQSNAAPTTQKPARSNVSVTETDCFAN